MKTLHLRLLLLVLTYILMMNHQVLAGGLNHIDLISSSNDGLSFSITPGEISANIVKTPLGFFVQIQVDGFEPGGLIGGPELPVLRRIIEVPLGASISYHITVTGRKEFSLGNLMPAGKLYPFQESACKHPDSAFVFKYNPGLYFNEAEQNQVVVMEDLGVMRNRRLVLVELRPYHYDVVNGKLSYSEKLDVQIVFQGGDDEATQQLKAKTHSPLFQVPESFLFGGGLKNLSEDILTQYPVKYVIVSHSMFQSQLQPFIAWKRKKGFIVVEAYTNNPAVGTTTSSIKAYLNGLYQNATPLDPAPTYLLIVGDVAQVPAFTGTTGSHVTDLYYAEYTGDKLPELYYGRFSASTLAELQPQIDKTLEYEQYLMADPSFLGKSLMVSGMDANYAITYGNGQINYGTNLYFNNSQGITSHTYLYPNSGSNAAQIIQHVSTGVGYANYTAHGGQGGWSDPSFTTTHIPVLANTGKYPLMVGNACLTNSFQFTACFGEALLRASGKGAIGYIGASNNTYWDEDFYWGVGFGTVTSNPNYSGTGLGAYDRLFHTHGETFQDWYVTQGQMIHAGNLAVQASGSSRKAYYWEVYHLMGDPSLMIYFGVPPSLYISHSPIISPMATSFSVQTEPYAYVAITRAGVLHAAALADSSGLAMLDVDPLISSGQADIVVSRQNRQPYIGTLNITTPSGAYVIAKGLVIDSTSNGNLLPEYGEFISLAVVLQNAGQQASSAIDVSITSIDGFITLIDSVALHPGLGTGITDTLPHAFLLKVNADVPDQHKAGITVVVRTVSDTFLFSEYLNILAPRIELAATTIMDTAGNGNGKADPGEQIALGLSLINMGQATATKVRGHVDVISPYLYFSNTYMYIDTILTGGQVDISVPVLVSSSAPQGYAASVRVIFEIDSCLSLVDTIHLIIGKAPVVVVDLDPNRSSGPSVLQAIEDNGVIAEYVTVMPSDLSDYQAVFVCLGIYSQNYVLKASEGNTLTSYLYGGGKVYMEGGDTWFYDPKTTVHPLFKITGTSDGSSDLGTVVGISGKFTNGMSFTYSGEKNWIDRIVPQSQSSAFTILSNVSPSYHTGVAFDTTIYRTIGSSHEFGGLADASFPSTKANLMRAYLGFFGINPDTLLPGFTVSPSNPCKGNAVVFNDTSQGVVVSYYWMFEGGTPSYSELPQPSVVWTQNGVYAVSLTISNGYQSYTTTQNAAVSVTNMPAIILQPTDTIVPDGSSAAFFADASDFVSCHWYSSQDGGSSWTLLNDNVTYTGTNSNALQINHIDTNMNGLLYACRFMGVCNTEVISLHASLSVSPNEGITGRLYYANNDSILLQNMVIRALGPGGSLIESNTGSTGWYVMPLSQYGDYSLTVDGNFPWSGVNSSDALLVLKHFVSISTLTGLPLSAADVDNSGYVNASDALLISKRFVGVVSHFPLGDWVIEPDQYVFTGGMQRQDIGLLNAGDVDASFQVKQKTVAEVDLDYYTQHTGGAYHYLPLIVESDIPIAAFSLVMKWQEEWALVDILQTENIQGQLHWFVQGDELRISWYSLNPYLAHRDGELFILKVDGHLDIKDFKKPVLDYVHCTDLDAGLISQAHLKLSIPLMHKNRIEILNPYPLPNQGSFLWPIVLQDAGFYQLDVYDLSGRLVVSHARQAIGPGYHKLDFNLALIKGSYLAVLSLETSADRTTKAIRLPVISID